MSSSLQSDRIFQWLNEIYRPQGIALWGSISFLVALAGPFGTYEELGPIERLAFWGMAIAFVNLCSKPCRKAMRAWTARAGFWGRAAVGSAALATIAAPAVKLLHGLFLGGNRPESMSFITLWMVFFLSSIVETGLWSVMRREPASAADRPEAAEPEMPRLMTRLDPELRGDLLSISVNDHYVEVTTDRGQGNVLLRFADAMDELGETEGCRVHRSHWVARSAMKRVERAAGRYFLRLTDDRRLPVSRSYRDEVLALGLPVEERDGRAANGTGRGGEARSTAEAPRRIRRDKAGSVQDSPPV